MIVRWVPPISTPQSKSRVRLLEKRDSLSAHCKVWTHMDLIPGVSSCPAERIEEGSHRLKTRDKITETWKTKGDCAILFLRASFFPLNDYNLIFVALHIWCTASYFFPYCISKSWSCNWKNWMLLFINTDSI